METTLKQYRFKTEQEFEFFFGTKWMNITQWNKKGEMNHLFGKECNIRVRGPLQNKKPHLPIGISGGWHIYPNMLLSDIESRHIKLKKLKKNING